jgi:hypothetical protein
MNNGGIGGKGSNGMGINDNGGSNWNNQQNSADSSAPNTGYQRPLIVAADFENHHCKQLTRFTAQKTYSMIRNWGSSAYNGGGASDAAGGNGNEKTRNGGSRFSSCNEFTLGINVREEKR